MVTVRLDCGEPATIGSTAALRRSVRAVARPGDGLEHVFAQPDPRGAALVMFLVAADLAAAERTARGLIARTGHDGLGGCRPTSCEVELIVPFAEAALPTDPP